MIRPGDLSPSPSRRALLASAASTAAALALPAAAFAQKPRMPFPQWVAAFRARALARGVSEATYTRVMDTVKPDMTVFTASRNQPEFNQQLWQYINRRVSDWRIIAGRERAREYAGLLSRIERDFGVSAASSSGCGASNPRSAIPWCRRTTCAR